MGLAKSDSTSRIARVSSSAETAVVCDTTCYLPTELVAKRGIKTISLYVSVDGHQERESEISDFDDFYERLRASESGATTSQPSIGDFLEVYEPLLAEDREVVSIHISAGISGTFEASAFSAPPRPRRPAPTRRGASPAPRSPATT
jgi:DegV family protein with EDD domain